MCIFIFVVTFIFIQISYSCSYRSNLCDDSDRCVSDSLVDPNRDTGVFWKIKHQQVIQSHISKSFNLLLHIFVHVYATTAIFPYTTVVLMQIAYRSFKKVPPPTHTLTEVVHFHEDTCTRTIHKHTPWPM